MDGRRFKSEYRKHLAGRDAVKDSGRLLCVACGHPSGSDDARALEHRRKTTKFIAAAAVNTTLVGESIALHRARTTMVWQAMIKRAHGKLCAVHADAVW
jgi:hypothetical protein